MSFFRTLFIVLLILPGTFSILPAQTRNSIFFDRKIGDIDSSAELIYLKGLNFLQKTQLDSGAWPGRYGNDQGVVGLAVLSMLAHGDDPNTGKYSKNISRGIRYIIKNQKKSGYIGNSMYNHANYHNYILLFCLIF